MRTVIGIVGRLDTGRDHAARAAATAEAVHLAKSNWRVAFPTREPDIDLVEWTSPDGTVAVLHWSNEPHESRDETLFVERDRCLSIMGYTQRGIDLDALSRDGDIHETSTRLPGCFGVIRASSDAIEVVTDVTRSNNFFVACNDGVRVVGSRAVLVAAVAAGTRGSSALRIQRDVLAARYMANLGHFIFDYTPFAGVRALGCSTLLRLSGEGQTASQLEPETSSPEPIRGRQWREHVEQTAESLVSAFDVIPPGDLTISLTGGRDSRLLAAALRHRPDFNVRSGTMGRPADPDVVIAALIAELMGYSHSIQEPGGVVSDSRLMAEDPHARIIRNLDVHDGMTSAWDDIVDYPSFNPTPAVSGVGGEILRGGLVWTHLAEMSTEQAVSQLRNFLLGGPFFSAESDDFALKRAAEILDLAEAHPHEAADQYYRIHRNGRWVSARRTGARMSRPMFDPLLDNRFIRSVVAVSPEQRWSERLVFDVINVLEPRLRDLPIEGERWRFERAAPDGEAAPGEVATWRDREALVRDQAVRRYSWQRLENPEVRDRIVTLILDATASTTAQDLFDRAKLEAYLALDPFPYPTVIWHLATTAVMLTEPWYLTIRPPRLRTIEISLTP